jgi:hypothetical protein
MRYSGDLILRSNALCYLPVSEPGEPTVLPHL